MCSEQSSFPFAAHAVREATPAVQVLPLTDAQLSYWPDWAGAARAARWWQSLLHELPWQQRAIEVYGRQVMQPRLTCWVGDPGAVYTYSQTRHEPLPWNESLVEIKQALELHCHHRFNSVLGNYYRNGQDGMGWHSDHEPELGATPLIASLSLGQARRFVLRRKDQPQIKHSIELAHGSLLLMAGQTQQYWQHALPKTAKPCEGRINLTFRWIYPR